MSTYFCPVGHEHLGLFVFPLSPVSSSKRKADSCLYGLCLTHMREPFLVSDWMKTQQVKLGCGATNGFRGYFIPFAQASLGPSSYLEMIGITCPWVMRNNDSTVFTHRSPPLELEAVGGAVQPESFVGSPHGDLPSFLPLTCKQLVTGRDAEHT